VNYERRFTLGLVAASVASTTVLVAAGEWVGFGVVGLLIAFAVLCVFGAAAGLARASDPSQGGGDE